MTNEQIQTAQQYQDYHTEQFGYSNIQFIQGYLEDLDSIESLQPNSFDLIISNCVLNLCPNKLQVLQSCYKLLKNGDKDYGASRLLSEDFSLKLKDYHLKKLYKNTRLKI